MCNMSRGKPMSWIYETKKKQGDGVVAFGQKMIFC